MVGRQPLARLPTQDQSQRRKYPDAAAAVGAQMLMRGEELELTSVSLHLGLGLLHDAPEE